MRNFKFAFFVVGLTIIVFTCSGCALLSIPGQLISGAFNLIGQGINAAGSLPTPPPWVFF